MPDTLDPEASEHPSKARGPEARIQDLAARADALVEKAIPRVVRIRRHLHRHPEVGWRETETQAYLCKQMEALGLQPVRVGGTGLYADVGEGPDAVLYRADIDALPITDAKQLGYAACVSENPGACHACGHDAHSAIAVGLAKIFRGLGSDLPGRVRVLFQPAEEVTPSGAQRVIAEGALDGVRAALALHCDPTRDTATVAARLGAFTSISDMYRVVVVGHEGHSARPHLARDAIFAAADVVRALYGVVPRVVNPLDTAVITVGTLRGGDVENVIAGRVELSGTVRCFDADLRAALHTQIREVSEAAARVHGCTVECSFRLGSPPIHNDARIHELMLRAAAEVVGENGVQIIERPSTGAEDFGQFSACIPSYMLRLGVRRRGGPTLHLHTPSFDLDEGALPVAMRIMARAVVQILLRPEIRRPRDGNGNGNGNGNDGEDGP